MASVKKRLNKQRSKKKLRLVSVKENARESSGIEEAFVFAKEIRPKFRLDDFFSEIELPVINVSADIHPSIFYRIPEILCSLKSDFCSGRIKYVSSVISCEESLLETLFDEVNDSNVVFLSKLRLFYGFSWGEINSDKLCKKL